MKISKFTTSNAYQVEVAYRTYIVFDEVYFEESVALILKSEGVFSGSICDPDATEQFKLEWSKINEL